MNHCIANGTSFWHFFNSWYEISHGFDHPSKLPSLVRGFAPDHLNRLVKISLLEKEVFDEFNQPPLKERIFYFRKENIAELKSKANDEIGKTFSGVYSLQALMAYTWRSIVCCHNVDDFNQHITFKLYVGTKNRRSPPLPEGYLGNGFC
ncbi:HXXXD-type acyl-transferase family protein [Abeliophyllum distichum]|uniref:HXXXD-type acyl-transferase family protein n=1 Tax=Abeliophyllum distichum TaxID=126358 RepID=A0ABD1Q2W0_9LAMI